MRISIFGLGYVGAVSLACLARDGHNVVGVDIDSSKLDLIRSGRSPIVEHGIQELMRQVVASGKVSVTANTTEAIANSDLSFVCVGTPSSSNGSQDLTALTRLAQQLGEALKAKDGFHAIVLRSTIQPGVTESIVAPIVEQYSGKKLGVGFGLAFQPEFLREGTSIKDYDNPPFTIVGASDDQTAKRVSDLFSHLPCEMLTTQIRTAEMLKMACNAFHALKITFANEIGRIAQSCSVDSHAVMKLVCQDTRLNISAAYMRPGFAFGGSCLPKDLRALTYLARTKDVHTPLLGSLLASNRVHIDHALDVIMKQGRRRVAMVGLAFKTGTDDLRESPLVTMAKRLLGEGYSLRIYDPDVHLSSLIGANRRYIEDNIPHIGSMLDDSLTETIANSDTIVLGLGTPSLAQAIVEQSRPDQHVLDLVNMEGREKLRASYTGVCW